MDRQAERAVLDIEVLDILEGKENRNRERNKRKDIFTQGYKDWNYCIEGNSLDGDKIRIIISFDEQSLLIITVIRLGSLE